MTTVTNKTPCTMSAQLSAAYAHETAYKDLCATMRTAKVRTIHVARACATTGMSLTDKVIYKAMRLVCRRASSRDAIVPRTPRNSATKRAAITARDNGRHAVSVHVHHEAHIQGVSVHTLLARKEQGAIQRSINATRKEANALARQIRLMEGSMEAHDMKPSVVQTPIVRTRTPKRTKVWHMMHTSASVAKQAAERDAIRARDAAHNALMAKYKADMEIAKARRAEKRALWIELRARRIQRMVTQVWFDKGIMVDAALQRACNDADHDIRTTAYTELLSLVGVAA
jgi:hypothetical protein